MKKFIVALVSVFLWLTLISIHVKAESKTTAAVMTTTSVMESAKAQNLMVRLNEINSMDKSSLNSSEKRQLRKEVRQIKSKLSEIGGGVYLSVGAIIIIVLLLILLL